jgi:hypothetical protein
VPIVDAALANRSRERSAKPAGFVPVICHNAAPAPADWQDENVAALQQDCGKGGQESQKSAF